MLLSLSNYHNHEIRVPFPADKIHQVTKFSSLASSSMGIPLRHSKSPLRKELNPEETFLELPLPDEFLSLFRMCHGYFDPTWH